MMDYMDTWFRIRNQPSHHTFYNIPLEINCSQLLFGSNILGSKGVKDQRFFY